MSKKFQNKYRIPSARAQWWDYGNNASYFVTICTANRKHFFGEILNDEMQLSPLGKMAVQCYTEIPQHFPFILLDEFVVMPNHVHAIIMIDKPPSPPPKPSKPAGGFAGDKNPMLNENLSRVLRWYKGRVTFECKKIQPGFGWQPRFHDHIIRNEESYQKIKNYIITNPKNWDTDRFKN